MIRTPLLARRRFLAAGLAAAFAPHPALAASPTLQVIVDDHYAPDLAAWAQALPGLCQGWWPKIMGVLASPGFTPPDRLEIVLVKIQPSTVAAETRGARIYVDADHVRKDPDTGFIAHEAAHVAQAYPGGVKWLKEGIADYIRYYVLFPDPRRPLPPGLTYQVGYLPAAAMLDWASRRYSRTLVRDVNAAMRAGHDGEGALAQITGQTPQGLWAAFTASRAAAAKKAA